jgi:hypothetical protein
MDYTIYPYEGVGPLRLGMTQQEIRAILGEPEDIIPAGVKSDMPADYYPSLGFYIMYKEPGITERVFEKFSRVA